MNNAPEVFASADIAKNQMHAGDPANSVWVSANAGSGKTHILTKRVLRLLLSGVAPQNILCLTYTKAAAAEMKSRIGASLGKWALLPEAQLSQELTKISNKNPSHKLIKTARTLFALALETPGGLKINTIHGFCEAALHRFPLEAGVPVNFSVIEDDERKKLIERAIKRVLAQGLAREGLSREGLAREGIADREKIANSVADIFAHMGDDGIDKAIKSALGQVKNLRHVLADIELAKDNLAKFLEIKTIRTTKEIEAEIVKNTLFEKQSFEQAINNLQGDSTKKRSKFPADFLVETSFENLEASVLLLAFLTKEGKPRAKLMLAMEAKKYPQLLELFQAEQDRILHLAIEIKNTLLLTRSNALLDVLNAIQQTYEGAKRANEKLDFDDLVTSFENLLARTSSSEWVRYKMDAGMTHILVDESQDTNPDQWRVVKLLVKEFFVGESSAQNNRTIFGVGDEKQSIFGFQGAKPELFAATGNELKLAARQAKKPFEKIPFIASFRTLPKILDAVDKLCARPDIARALLAIETKVFHESARTDKGGEIVFWPLPDNEKAPKSDEIWLDEPIIAIKTKERQTAQTIVGQIKYWLDSSRPLGGRARAVAPQDILILVQKRGALFNEIIRALKSNNIPTPGADRLLVNSHIAVQDLRALAEVLLNPNDDLTLAALLRSPLFDISEQELELICIGRKKNISVWQTLGALAKTNTKTNKWAKTAYDDIFNMRSSLDFERPYEFFAQVLFARQGLKKFHSRMGEEIDDVINAFLDLALEHEQSSQPSLQGFLAMLRQQEIEIKRELGDTIVGVRVMSVHGAKGLEAPIVILADATSKPVLKESVFFGGEDKPMLAHGTKMDFSDTVEEAFREPKLQSEKNEYWRKLYVAMTRAEDELYITGYTPISKDDKKNPGQQQTWYGAVLDALEGDTREVDMANHNDKAICYPKNPVAALPIANQLTMKAKKIDLAVPGKLSPIKQPEIIRPSSTDEDFSAKEFSAQKSLENLSSDDEIDLYATGVENIREAFDAQAGEEARLKGLALHALLQYLAPIEEHSRAKTGKLALEKILPKLPEAHDNLLAKAVKILGGPNAGLLFGKNSRAELPIFVSATKVKKPVRIIGRIDRTIVESDRVLLVDFKSSVKVPESLQNVKRQYLVQMGLYLRCGEKLFPNYKVSTAIYWTQNQSLMPLENSALLKATDKFNII